MTVCSRCMRLVGRAHDIAINHAIYTQFICHFRFCSFNFTF